MMIIEVFLWGVVCGVAIVGIAWLLIELMRDDSEQVLGDWT